MAPGLVTMCVDASADPWVSHGDELRCPDYLGGQPHRMSACTMFDHTVPLRQLDVDAAAIELAQRFEETERAIAGMRAAARFSPGFLRKQITI